MMIAALFAGVAILLRYRCEPRLADLPSAPCAARYREMEPTLGRGAEEAQRGVSAMRAPP